MIPGGRPPHNWLAPFLHRGLGTQHGEIDRIMQDAYGTIIPFMTSNGSVSADGHCSQLF